MDNLKVFYQNVRGLRTKTDIFYRNLQLNNYDIICLTETWLLPSIKSEELFDDSYIVFRRDRDYERTSQSLGGGVLIAVKRGLVAVTNPDWCSSAEDVWLTVTLPGRRKDSNRLHICCIYLCNQALGFNSTSQLGFYSDKLQDIFTQNSSDLFLLVGDFNLSSIQWSQQVGESALTPSTVSGDILSAFFDTLILCNLSQFNFIRNQNNRILDLVFSNTPLNINVCVDPLVPEDGHHPALLVELDHSIPHRCPDKPRVKYFYGTGDYFNLCDELDKINWQSNLSINSLDEALDFFYKTLYSLRDKYVHHKTISTSSKHPPWFTSSLIKILGEKNKHNRKYKIYGNRSDYVSFSILRDRARKFEKECYNLYINKIETAIAHSPKAFWSFVKSKTSNLSFPSTMTYGNEIANTGEGLCELFSKFFISNFLQPTSNTASTSASYRVHRSDNTVGIGSIEISLEALEKSLKSLDINKSAGSDDLPPLFIVKCSQSLTLPLGMIFSRSVEEGVVPTVWKSALVSPVHKKGSKSQVENYRPISKLCIFAKLLEKIVYTQTYAALKPTFIQDQHGFLKGRSTTSNLILTNEFIIGQFALGHQVDGIYTDFSKAFDRLDHYLLLKKLQSAGIHGSLFRWYSSYIERRSQAVVLNGFRSSWSTISSGVPQGSLLGPLLFVIFINDIDACFLHSKFYLFADDMKILKSIGAPVDSIKLQDDLCRFDEYCLSNKLDLNVEKCYALSFSRKRKINIIQTNYFLKGKNLSRVDVVRDLGILQDSKLTYIEHIDNIVTKSLQSLGFIMRVSAPFNSIKTLKILYCAYVRSNLEYCSQVWNPRYDCHTRRIEMTQRKFLKYLQFRSQTFDNDYEQRCKRHHLLPLQKRRTIADLTYYLNIIKAKVDSPELLGKISFSTPTTRSRHTRLLAIPSVKANYNQNTFFWRTSSFLNSVLQNNNQLDIFFNDTRSFRQYLSTEFFGYQT